MTSDLVSDELKDFLLGKSENDEIDYSHFVAPCYSMSWDARHSVWIVRVDNKRVMELGAGDVPPDFEFRSYELVQHILSVLRESGPDGLRLHIEEMKCLGK
jgi:hypothetical protein